MKRINIRGLITSIILILVLALAAGCTLLPDIGIETSPPPPSPLATRNATPIDTEWSTPPTESQALILPSIADVVASVKPSVVAINTKATGYDSFNRPYTREGGGSGWIISEDGIIVTNNHVVADADNITVTLDDGRVFPVDLNTVATDWLADLAVFKIDAENLPAATVGDSLKLKVGDWVVAIGNALGEGISATTGIVSSLGVSLDVSPGQTLYDLIQTDAAINPGNSGGPLVNMAGEVIGITSVKTARVDVEGMGYAISTNEAMPIIKNLITNGYVVRPFLGVQGFYTVDQAVATYFDLSVTEGVLIRGVVPDSPADKAGLKGGDVVVSLNSDEIVTTQELVRAIHSYEIGQQVAIIYWRGETKQTAYATLAESPPSP